MNTMAIDNNVIAKIDVEEEKTSVPVSIAGTVVEPMVIGAQQREIHHKMIEHVKEYHSKLDLSQHKGKGKVDLYVCCICFEIFPKQESLRLHFMKVCVVSFIVDITK